MPLSSTSGKQGRPTVKPSTQRIPVFDKSLVDVHALCPCPRIDLHRILRPTLIDHKAIREARATIVEDEIALCVGDFVRGAVDVPDYAGIPEGFATEHGVVEGGLDVVGY